MKHFGLGAVIVLISLFVTIPNATGAAIENGNLRNVPCRTSDRSIRLAFRERALEILSADPDLSRCRAGVRLRRLSSFRQDVPLEEILPPQNVIQDLDEPMDIRIDDAIVPFAAPPSCTVTYQVITRTVCFKTNFDGTTQRVVGGGEATIEFPGVLVR